MDALKQIDGRVLSDLRCLVKSEAYALAVPQESSIKTGLTPLFLFGCRFFVFVHPHDIVQNSV